MASPRLTPDEMSAWRHELYLGRQLDAAVARRLMDELERLGAELAEARVTFAKKAAEALQKRLQDVAVFNHGGCVTCHEAEARAFLARLWKVATVDAEKASR
jgi:Spy/CpxP family protein refolding chaperone